MYIDLYLYFENQKPAQNNLFVLLIDKSYFTIKNLILNVGVKAFWYTDDELLLVGPVCFLTN